MLKFEPNNNTKERVGVDSETEQQGQLYIQLLVGSGMLSRQELMDFKAVARDLNKPLIQAIMSSGSLDKRSLDLAGMALGKIRDKTISPDLAIRALRVALQTGVSLDAALNETRKAHRTTRIVVSATNELTNLLIDANVITREQLGPMLVKSTEFNSLIGQVMILENLISLACLKAALSAVVTARGGKIQRNHVVEGLRVASTTRVSFEQALFELGTFVAPDAREATIGEIALMAGVITEADYAECLEIELFKNKEFDHILVERGLLTPTTQDAAMRLMVSIASGVLYPHEAAQALHLVCRQQQRVYDVMSDMHGKREGNVNVRLGDLLVDSEVCTRATIETAINTSPENAVKVGSVLLKSRLLAESTLYIALRLQASLRLGYVVRDDAIRLLRLCFTTKVSLEEAMTELGVYIPPRMQWAWV